MKFGYIVVCLATRHEVDFQKSSYTSKKFKKHYCGKNIPAFKNRMPKFHEFWNFID